MPRRPSHKKVQLLRLVQSGSLLRGWSAAIYLAAVRDMDFDSGNFKTVNQFLQREF
jgi:hypothetical protein